MYNTYNNTVAGPWIDGALDTQYRIEETDSSITVTFQGSCSKLDWRQNFSFWKLPYKGMKHLFFVHAGFDNKYRAVKDDIMQDVGEAVALGKKVTVSGYSQGAALAQRHFEDVWYNVTKDVVGIGFGTPMSFSIWGSKYLKERFVNFTRVENGNDIVTKLAGWLFGYRHYGKVIHIGSKRRFWKFSIKDHTTYEGVLEGGNK